MHTSSFAVKNYPNSNVFSDQPPRNMQHRYGVSNEEFPLGVRFDDPTIKFSFRTKTNNSSNIGAIIKNRAIEAVKQSRYLLEDGKSSKN